jgi:hypothetical protein
MTREPRAVIDTNALVSFLLSRGFSRETEAAKLGLAKTAQV